jgi:pimeloyl-ACP methyl ester carboxylesterase
MPSRHVPMYASRPGKVKPQRHDFTYQYNKQAVKYSVWSTGSPARISTVIFLGTVQIGRLPAWIVRRCPADTVVVQGAPHWLAKEDGSDIPVFMHRFTEEAFKSILATYKIKKLRVIAESQAVPAVLGLLTSREYSSRVDRVALLQPLGLNASVFAGTASDRIALFKKRMARNFRHQVRSLLFDRWLLYNHGQILKTVGYNNAKSHAQYGSGLGYDATDDLKKVDAIHIPIGIVCGENDKMFPPQEIQSTLRKVKLEIPLFVVPGIPHSPLASRMGMKLLSSALERLETNEGNRSVSAL